MSIEILTDIDSYQSVMFCNTGMVAFGPVFGEEEDPQDFLDWYDKNYCKTDNIGVRMLSDQNLLGFVERWRKETSENEAEEASVRYFNDTEATSYTETLEKSKRVK